MLRKPKRKPKQRPHSFPMATWTRCTLTRRDRLVYWRAVEAIKEHGVPLDAASTEMKVNPRQATMHVYEVRPRKDKRGVGLNSDVLPFGRLWYGGRTQ